MSKIKNSVKSLSLTKNAIAKRAKKALIEQGAKVASKTATFALSQAEAIKVLSATPVCKNTFTVAPVLPPVLPTVAPLPVVVAVAPVKSVIAGLDTVNDILVTIGNSWNAAHGEIVAKIDLQDNSFPFNRYEYAAEVFPNSKWSVLRTTDNGLEVGVPFDAKSYSVFTNAKRKTFLEKLISGIEKTGIQCVIETAGTLKDRSKQFVSIRLVGLDKLQAGGREIESFLSLLTAIDKSLSFTLVNSTLTVCCANTFETAKNQTGAPLYAKVKMTRNADFKIDEVPLIVESFVSGNNELLAQLNQWHSIGLTNIQAETLFAAWLGDAGKPMSTRLAGIVNRLRELHVTGKGNKGETALDAFEAVTEYYTHESAGETDNVLKQFESSEIGAGAMAKAEFFDYLVKAFETTATFDGICKVGENILVATRAAAAAK